MNSLKHAAYPLVAAIAVLLVTWQPADEGTVAAGAMSLHKASPSWVRTAAPATARSASTQI